MSRSSTGLSLDGSLTAEEQERLASILDEYLVSLELGAPQSTDALIADHPEFAEHLRSYLSGLELLQNAAAGFGSATDDQKPDQQAGTKRLGDFELHDEIGRGGMGVVYEAHQISLNRRVAVKVLPFASVLDSKQIARFKNEAHAAAQLHHPNIVQVHAIGQDQGVNYYAMQFIDGQPLDEVVRELRRQAKDSSEAHLASPGSTTKTSLQTAHSNDRSEFFRGVARVGIQAARALDVAHDFGVVHRDIKPSNILLDTDGKAWVTDFGLARFQSDSNLTRTGDIVGTVRYMSPEQAAGRSLEVDHRSDVYSLGVTLYELLTLCPAIRGDDGPEILRRIEQNEPTRPRKVDSTIPADLETILSKAISKMRDDRYATAGEFADDLQRFLDGLPTVAKPPTAPDRIRKWTRRHRTLVRVFAGFATMAAAGLLVCTLLVARENLKTQRALDDAEANLELAKKNYEQARDTVDRFGARLAERLAAVQGAESIRRSLLQDTLKYYEGFLEQSNDDPNLKEDIAVTYSKIGTISEQIGRTDDAIEAYERGQAKLEALLEVRPDNELIQSRLGVCRNNLALLLLERGDVDRSRDLLNQALQLQLELCAANPKEERFEAELALTRNNLGLLLDHIGETGEAEQLYAQAARDQRALSERFPTDSRVLRDLAGTLNNLSIIRSSSAPLDAIPIAEEAMRIHERLVRLESAQTTTQQELALACNNVGALYARVGLIDEAITCYHKSIDILTKLRKQSPAVRQLQNDLAVTQNNLGLLYARRGDTSTAINSFGAAISLERELLAADSSNPNYCSSLAGMMNNLGMVLIPEQREGEAHDAFLKAVELQRIAIELAPKVVRFRSMLSSHYVNLRRSLHRQSRHEELVQCARDHREFLLDEPANLLAMAKELSTYCHDIRAGAVDGSFESIQYVRVATETLELAVKAGLPTDGPWRNSDAFAALLREPVFQQFIQSLDAVPGDHVSRDNVTRNRITGNHRS